MYELTTKERLLESAMRAIERPRYPTLAEQHLTYCLQVEDNRAAIAQRTLANTAILTHVAEQLAADEPNSAGAMKEIMEAYLEGVTESVRNYSIPDARSKPRWHSKNRHSPIY